MLRAKNLYLLLCRSNHATREALWPAASLLVQQISSLRWLLCDKAFYPSIQPVWVWTNTDAIWKLREGIHPSGYYYSSAQFFVAVVLCCHYIWWGKAHISHRPSLFLTDDDDDDDDSVLIGQHNYILHCINERSLLGGVEKSHNLIYPFQHWAQHK